MQPIAGTYRLNCVAPQYTDGPGGTLEACQAAVDEVKAAYEQNSRGLLKFTTKALVYDSGRPRADWRLVEDAIQAKFPADYWIIPNLWRQTVSNAGRRVAHIGKSMSSSKHEIGHLVGLAHSGAYINGVYDDYGDRQSWMGGYSSAWLVASQLYYLGWLPTSEVAYYEKTRKQYTLKRINDQTGPGLATVIVPPEAMGHTDGRYAFVSFPIKCDTCIVIHLSTGGGSRKIVQFADEIFEQQFTGLHIKRLSSAPGTVTIKIGF